MNKWKIFNANISQKNEQRKRYDNHSKLIWTNRKWKKEKKDFWKCFKTWSNNQTTGNNTLKLIKKSTENKRKRNLFEEHFKMSTTQIKNRSSRQVKYTQKNHRKKNVQKTKQIIKMIRLGEILMHHQFQTMKYDFKSTFSKQMKNTTVGKSRKKVRKKIKIIKKNEKGIKWMRSQIFKNKWTLQNHSDKNKNESRQIPNKPDSSDKSDNDATFPVQWFPFLVFLENEKKPPLKKKT